jgi:hypothetical protein
LSSDAKWNNHIENIIFETSVQIPEVELGGKYGYTRANTDICPEGK